MLRAIFNNSSWQHPTKQWLYAYQPPITKIVQVGRTRHVGNGRRSKDDLISDILPWTLSHGRAKAGRPSRTYIQQVCADTRWRLEDFSWAMDDRLGWRKRVRDIRTDGATWWWWRWWLALFDMKKRFDQHLKSGYQGNFPRRWPLHHKCLLKPLPTYTYGHARNDIHMCLNMNNEGRIAYCVTILFKGFLENTSKLLFFLENGFGIK